MDDFFVLGGFIESMIAHERPSRILEISEGGSKYGHLLKACQEHCGISSGVVDRIAIPASPPLNVGLAYTRIFGQEHLNNPHLIDKYDCILILDLLERMEPEKAKALLHVLQHKVTRQILSIVALDSGAGFRKYHPIVFLGLDFSYSLVPNLSKAMQSYSVFPEIKHTTMEIDCMPETEAIEKMNIAFVLPHHALTGGMKALLQQIQHLKRNGHTMSVYFRSGNAESAIPPWSVIANDDCIKQVVIPESGLFLDYIQGADIIILGGIDQAFEFRYSKIPIVLWEQGYQALFGDYGMALYSLSLKRLSLHGLYRLPVHLLAVSDVISKVLKGVYNRDAFIYPNGVDTDFYHPAEKHNETPVVLLTGHPSLAFKGFRFAFDVLQRAYADGLRFQVKWAAQVEVIHGKINFPLEVIVNPTQHELANMYRSADIFLSTSLYESYSLPPLEAMASGTAVIATDCGGIRAYAKHGENCILCRQGDLPAMANALATLINFQHERQRLAQAGRETALEHSAETVVGMLERRLSDIVRYDRDSRASEK